MTPLPPLSVSPLTPPLSSPSPSVSTQSPPETLSPPPSPSSPPSPPLIASSPSLKQIAEGCTVPSSATLPLLNPQHAQREELKMRLPNGMSVLLVSYPPQPGTPSPPLSAASLAVKVGSHDDPLSQQGIAHFTEHLLFMGTEKYPEEAGYNNHISEHGGFTNAYTADGHTVYGFSCSEGGFLEALDRFSWFFRAPLFDPSGVERERHAIDQEFSMMKNNDEWRVIHVLKELTLPTHPCSYFDCGNNASMAHIQSEEVEKWYQEKYSAHLMTLAIQSSLPMERLKQEVVRLFSPIAKSSTTSLPHPGPCFDPSYQGKWILVPPKGQKRRLQMLWELPPSFSHHIDEKPEMLIAHTLGHEGETSLLAQLKREGLVHGLAAQDVKYGAENPTFLLDLTLTPLGLQQKERVLKRCYQAIANLRRTGISASLFEEVKKLSQLAYQNQELAEDPFDQLCQNAIQLLDEPLESYPEKTLIPQKYDPDLVLHYLSYLTPEACLSLLQADQEELNAAFPEKPLWKKEKWMEIPYAVNPLPNSLLEELARQEEHPQIQVPALNPYFPTDFTLFHPQHSQKTLSVVPESLHQSDQGEVFFAPDHLFGAPKVSWKFHIKTPSLIPQNARSQLLGDLIVSHFNSLLSSELYQAEEAGLSLQITKSATGILFSLHGYHDKALDFWESCLKKCAHSQPSQQDFELALDACQSEYVDAYEEDPCEEPLELVRHHFLKAHCTNREKLAEEVSYATFSQFYRDLFRQTYTEGMIHGNLLSASANQPFKQLQETLLKSSQPFKKADHFLKQAEAIAPGKPVQIQIENTTLDQVGLVAYSHGEKSEKKWLASLLLNSLMATAYFEELRTQKQMGYVVESEPQVYGKQMATLFFIQSSSHSSEEIIQASRNFLTSFLQELRENRAHYVPKFQAARSAALSSFQKGPLNSEEMAHQLYTLAFEEEKDFHKTATLVEELGKMEYDTFLKEVEDMFQIQRHGSLTLASSSRKEP